jgi:hypothetical protein
LDFCATRNGSSVRGLQNIDVDDGVSEYLAECFINAGRIRMPADAADFTSLRFSTRGLPERMRVPMWREEFGRCIVHADIEPSSDIPFHAEATLLALEGLRTLAWRGSAMRFKRLQANIVDGDDSIGIVVGSPGRSRLSQRGQEIEFRAGDAIALLHS